jgi:HK97 family phage portal protein
VGVSVIKYAANVLGISLAAQKFSQETFENRGVGYAVIEADGDIPKTKKEEIENAVNSKLAAEGKVKAVMLDDGHKYKSIQINNQEAQLVEQGKLSIADICRFLNISLHKVKMLDNANYNALNMLNIEHASDSIQPWAIKFSQEFDRKLFTENEKKDHYIKMNDNILLRADLATKGEWYSKAVQAGIMTRNEIRGLEELNKLDGLDEPLTPVNTQIQAQIEKTLQDD